MTLKVSDRPTNNFMQVIQRRLSILERPLVTARGGGKSYIYANFNPKYAQMALTILRTYYNFCLANKTKGKKKTNSCTTTWNYRKTVYNSRYFK